MSGHVWSLEVSEAAIWATRCGTDWLWWSLWRLRMETAGRIEVIRPSLGGDLVRVSCDSKSDAKWLRGHMTGFGGIPQRAVKVKHEVLRGSMS